MVMETLRDLWERNQRLHSDCIAVVGEGRRLSYKGLVDRAVRLANALGDGGAGLGDRVAILAMNRVEYMEVLAANHILGSIATTLNFRLVPAELQWILEDSSPSVLIFEKRYLETVASLRGKLAGGKAFYSFRG